MADNKFFNLFNDIDDKYIKEAEQTASGPDMYIEYVPGNISKRKMFFTAAGLVAACAALVIGIVKLPGIVFGLRGISDGPDSAVSSTGTNLPNGDTALDLRGDPIPENELEEFDIDGLTDGYRQTFSKELTAALDSIGKPEVTEVYCKARTLADLQTHILNVDIIATDRVKAKKGDNMRATIAVTLRSADPGFSDSKYDTREFYETGYSYDSFCRAFRDIFCEESADYLIMNSRYAFCDLNGGLYTHDTYSMEADSLGLVFTDYEVITNTDNEVVFNTVRYFDYADDWLTDEVREPYDPANKDTYLNREGKRFVMTNTNRLIKEDGVWKAYDIYYAHNQTRPVTFEDYRPDITDKLVLQGEPFPESAHTDFEYGQTLYEYTEELKKDEGLTALLEQIGDGEFKEQYYKARTLAEILAQNDDVYFNVREIGTILSFRDDYNQECDRYLEMGLKYDSFMKTLKETFGDKTIDYMLERGIFYNYNNSLCRSTRGFNENRLLVHNDYELVSQSKDEIVFDTLCYHIRPEEFDGFLFRWEKQPYYPSKKADYTVTKITNRFVKENGKWKAEEMCFLGDLSSVGEINTVEISENDKIDLVVNGTPLPESELVDFTYEEILENYRKILAGNSELTAVLRQINKPDFTESYYRARTLADMLAFMEGAQIKPSDKVLNKREPATVITSSRLPMVSSLLVYNEAGYKYESFKAAFRDVFGNDNAEKLLKRFSRFLEYDGGLYYVECKPTEDIYLVHTDYELKTNTDSEIVFDTVCYWVDSNYSGWPLTDWTTETTRPKFDPAKMEEYKITRISNRFVKENGKWKAEEVYMADGVSSAWDNSKGNIYTDDRGNSFMLSGTPLSERELADFDYEVMLENFRLVCGKDDELLALLEEIGKPEVTELYYKAGALADLVGIAPMVGYVTVDMPAQHKQVSITINEDTPPSIYSTIDSSYTKGQKFVETGIRSDSFMNALNEVFYAESSAMMLARFPYFFSYNGQLYYQENRERAEYPVYGEYKLLENSDDTVRFTTINYYAPPGSDLHGYFPSIKDEYVTFEVNNEFRVIDGKWKAYEICTLYGYSTRDGKMYGE